MIVIVLILAYILVIPGMYGLSMMVLPYGEKPEGDWFWAVFWPFQVVLILVIFIAVIVMSPYYLCIGGPERLREWMK